jgi:hypothetical protein
LASGDLPEPESSPFNAKSVWAMSVFHGWAVVHVELGCLHLDIGDGPVPALVPDRWIVGARPVCAICSIAIRDRNSTAKTWLASARLGQLTASIRSLETTTFTGALSLSGMTAPRARRRDERAWRSERMSSRFLVPTLAPGDVVTWTTCRSQTRSCRQAIEVAGGELLYPAPIALQSN